MSGALVSGALACGRWSRSGATFLCIKPGSICQRNRSLENDTWNSSHTWYIGDAARRFFSIPTVRNRVSSSELDFYYRFSLHLRYYGRALDPVRWCPKLIAKEVMWQANSFMICASVITPSLVLFVLAFLLNLFFIDEPFGRSLGFCKDYIETVWCF